MFFIENKSKTKKTWISFPTYKCRGSYIIWFDITSSQYKADIQYTLVNWMSEYEFYSPNPYFQYVKYVFYTLL